MEPNHTRINWVDSARGFGIFLVVLGHALRGLHGSGIIAADSRPYHLADSWIYSFHMPLFFLLSGLFAGRRAGREPGRFLHDQFATIAYPYLVWSALQTLMQMALGRYTNRQLELQEFAGILVHPIMQFWFLYALLVIGLIDYALRRGGLGPLGVLAAFTLFWASEGWFPTGGWLPLEAARSNGVFYALGGTLGHRGRIERIERAPATPLALVVLIGFLLVTATVVRPPGAARLAGLAVALCGIAASTPLGVLLARARGLDFVRVLGVYSLEIYVAHTIASAGVRIGLQRALRIEDVTVHLILGTIGGLVLSLALAMLCRRHRAEALFRLPRSRAGP